MLINHHAALECGYDNKIEKSVRGEDATHLGAFARGEEITFRVTGYGHGVGMSQYGANTLAGEGKSWKEILRWYYTGITIDDYTGP